MALRITKNEKKWLYSHNASATRKKNRLKSTYNINVKFKVKKPSEFTSRAELNTYKRNLKVFLLRNTHAYVKGGIVSRYFSEKGIEVPFAIPKSEYVEIQRILKRRNIRTRRQARLFKKAQYSVKGKPQSTKLATRVIGSYIPQGKLVYNYSSYRPLKLRPEYITSKGTWAKFSYAVKKYQSARSLYEKQKQMQKNYIKALQNTFGRSSDALVELISKLSVDEFVTYFESEEFSDFTYIYDEVEALNVVRYMTEHMINFVRDVKPVNITDVDVLEARDYYQGLSETAIIYDYGRGELKGERIYIDNNHYIDLDPNEVVQYHLGALNNEVFQTSPFYADRIHYQKRREKIQNGPTKIEDLL